MSLEKRTPMKPIRSTRGEGRRDWIRFGKDPSRQCGGFEKPKTTGVVRPVIVMAGSAWSECEAVRWRQAGRSRGSQSSNAKADREVGKARSSAETSVMERGAKGPYLVSVNSEAKEVRWLENRY